ncbi:MAG: SPFH domain-containing protein [Clostridia bacterium]|nr:SPFH domain-containing protein [Clostridia bacterium]
MAIVQLIEQEMTNDQLVVRSHIEDFNAKSQLIVYESQEAVFYKNGQALDLFGPGRHTLSSENVPLLKRIFGHLFGGKTPFPCDVYFVNKVNVLDIIWGTDSPVQLEDPKYPMLVSVRANGQTGVRVKDSRRFLINVVGQLKEYTVDGVRRAIKGMMMAAIKENLAIAIIEKKISILEVATKTSELSLLIQQKVNAAIADLGVELVHFTLSAILPSEGDLDELKALKKTMMNTEADMYRERRESETRAYARQTEGYTYHDERRFDVMEGAAKNEGGAGGSFINMGVGLGMGAGVGREMGNMYAGVMQPMNPTNPSAAGSAAVGKVCPSCGSPVAAGAKFCSNCGQAQPQVKFCPECGTRCEADSKFCMNCGRRLDA